MYANPAASAYRGLPGYAIAEPADWTREVSMYPTALRNTAPPERERLFFGYVTAVCVVAIVVTAFAMPDLPRHLYGDQLDYWILAAMAVIGDSRPVKPPGGRTSLTVFPSICF